MPTTSASASDKDESPEVKEQRRRVQADYDRKMASVRSHKGWLTRIHESAEQIAGMAMSGSATEDSIERLREEQKKFWDKADYLQNFLLEISTKYTSVSEETERHANEISKAQSEFTEMCSGALNAWERHCRDKNAEFNNSRETPRGSRASLTFDEDEMRHLPKIHETMKPKALTKENTPAEFRLWKEKFTAF